MISEHPQKHLILFLAANPSSTEGLALDKECAAIENELKLSSARDTFQFVSKWAVNVDEMMRHLNELQPTIIHFSGHGSGGSELHVLEEQPFSTRRDVDMPREAGEAGIHLHGESNQSHKVGMRALAQMIRAAAPAARIVVLNACFSDGAEAAFSGVVDCLVGMHGSVGDAAARSFSVGFYRALGHGRSVGNAIEQAAAGLAALQLPAPANPICRTREGIDANLMVLPDAAAQPQVPTTFGQKTSRPLGAARHLLSVLGSSNMNPGNDDLFSASLTHYHTVARAARELKEILFEQLVQWIDRHPFRTYVADDNWQTKPHRYDSDSVLYVSILVRGRFENEKCKLEFGLWWNRDRDDKVFIYAGFHDVPWAKKVKPTNNETRRDASSTAYLLRDATTARNPGSLLDELEAAARIARST